MPHHAKRYPVSTWMLAVLTSAALLLLLNCPGKDAVPEGATDGVRNDAGAADTLENRNRDRLLPPEERNRKPEFGGVINIRFNANPATLNQMSRGDWSAEAVCVFLYPRLLWIDYDSLDLVPYTAASMPEVSADKKVYTWHLRKGLKWHDFEESGAFLTSRDVKFSFDLMKDPATGPVPQASDFENLTDIRIVDDWTFEAVYEPPSEAEDEAPGPDAVFKMGNDFRIVPAHILEDVPPGEIAKHPIGREPVGYGPFRFVHWRAGEEILLKRDDRNRGIFPETFRPFADGLRFRLVLDDNMVMPLFMRGELDLTVVSPDDWRFKTRDPAFEAVGTRHCYYVPNWYYIAWNNDSPLFSDARVRRAMTHMVRRQEILETHLQGLGKVISGPFYYNSRGYDHSIKPLPFDPEEAVRLLKEAGFADHDGDGILDREIDGQPHKFEFEFLMSTLKNDYQAAVASTLTEDLRKIGIRMKVRELEFSALRKQFSDHNFDAVTLGIGTTPIYEDPYNTWHSSQRKPGKLNRAGYCNPEADARLDRVRAEYDVNERYRLLREFHRIVHEDQPFTFLYSRASSVAVNRRWRNVKIHKLGVLFYEWWLPPEHRKPSDEIPD